jgi:hypothetical protein
MLKKAYKTITRENGKIEIYGNGHDIELEYKVPEWNEETGEEEQCFQYKGNTYFLSEFTNIHNKVWQPNPPEWQLEFDGIKSDSYFSGILIKISEDGEGVKAYTYIS